MDRETVLSFFRNTPNPIDALFKYCIGCGKDEGLSIQFLQVLSVSGEIPTALNIVWNLYEINTLQDSGGKIIQYF